MLCSVVVCLVVFALGRKPRPPITMSIRGFVTNQYTSPSQSGATNYICAIIGVTNHSDRWFLWSAPRESEQGIFRTSAQDSRSLIGRTNFILETLVFRGFTNKVELTIMPMETPWVCYLPHFILRALPAKLQFQTASEPFKVSTPEFYVAKEQR